MEALLGFIIITMVFLVMLRGHFLKWIAGMIVFGISALTNNLSADMFGGIVLGAATCIFS